MPSQEVFVVLLLWTLVKFILYPPRSARRYVMLSRIIKLQFKQIVLFFIIYMLLSSLSSLRYFNSIDKALLFVLIISCSNILFFNALKVYRSFGYSYNSFITIGEFKDLDKVVSYLTKIKKSGNRFLHHFDTIDDIKSLEFFIIQNEIKEIYCSSKSISNTELNALLKISLVNDIPICLLVDNHLENIYSEKNKKTSLIISELSSLLSSRNLIQKRLFDLIVSAAVIILVLSWLIPLIGIAIKLDSKGPIFFLQPRAGRDGVYFYCIKFRSMLPSLSDRQASREDVRVTKVGRFLRRTSLDEFPQFINVLIGDMSIVGPRPHIKSLNDKYDTRIRRYFDRLIVKPGITGLSQISGYRGETTDDQSMLNRIRVDLLYIKSWSLFLDVKIVLGTLSKILFSKDQQAY